MLEVRRTPPLEFSSESMDKFDPARDGGLEPFRDPDPGIPDWRRVNPVMVSLSYPASMEPRALATSMPRLLSDFSLIFVIGPEILPLGCPDAPPDTELLGLAPGAASLVRLALKAVILCDAPGAKVNCSRSSTLVRPLARHGSFLTKNSSKAHQPPPTRTITVDRKIRTNRSF